MTKRNYEVTAAPGNDVQLQMFGNGDSSPSQGSPSKEPYDPHLHRNRPTPTT